ncbi:hypothetical protein DPMN_001493 [Dreissena polymorpha]|uniref:Uncharacterized protein n=1 Tax=Dreissena polymorpha TaxID=45954 RepID=A0A9D4RSX2_DREPO|nr:hypothetical protein DPMN_001493 [Dreissena polymorpha]
MRAGWLAGGRAEQALKALAGLYQCWNRILKAFANSLDPDETPQNPASHQDPNSDNILADDKFPSMQSVNGRAMTELSEMEYSAVLSMPESCAL